MARGERGIMVARSNVSRVVPGLKGLPVVQRGELGRPLVSLTDVEHQITVKAAKRAGRKR